MNGSVSWRSWTRYPASANTRGDFTFAFGEMDSCVLVCGAVVTTPHAMEVEHTPLDLWLAFTHLTFGTFNPDALDILVVEDTENGLHFNGTPSLPSAP
jgi:hypothetical protein